MIGTVIQVGPGRYCSAIRHKLSFNFRREGSNVLDYTRLSGAWHILLGTSYDAV